MNAYQEMKQRHKAERDAFPFVYAFSEEQWRDGVRMLGLAPGGTDKVVNIGEPGIFCLPQDPKAAKELFARQKHELEEAITSDTTGDSFIHDMFLQALQDSDFKYSGYIYEALETVGITMGQVESDPRLLRGLNEAKKECLK